jgi:hypothetical protein
VEVRASVTIARKRFGYSTCIVPSSSGFESISMSNRRATAGTQEDAADRIWLAKSLQTLGFTFDEVVDALHDLRRRRGDLFESALAP